MSDSAHQVLDGGRIRALRLAAGFSRRGLARRLGLSPTSITNLEAGTNHGELPLRILADLASALGVASAELFPRDTDAAPAPADDDRVIEAALMIASSPTSTRELADALGWGLARVRSAVRILDARLTSRGLRVRDCGWQRHALRPATKYLTDRQQHDLQRLGPTQRGLTAPAAAVLRDVADGRIDESELQASTAGRRIAIQVLLKQGLIVAPPDGGPVRLSEGARYGLYPDIEPGASSSPRARQPAVTPS